MSKERKNEEESSLRLMKFMKKENWKDRKRRKKQERFKSVKKKKERVNRKIASEKIEKAK